MVGENSTYNILVELQSKRQVYLLGEAGTAVSRVAPFHLGNHSSATTGSNQLSQGGE